MEAPTRNLFADMLKNYLTAALRQFRVSRWSAVVNVLSFAAALACCAIIALYVRYERSYDRYHDHADRTFRLVTETGGPFASHTITAPRGIAPALPEMFAEVVTATGVGRLSTSYVMHGDRRHPAEGFFFVDSLFFDVFTYPLVEGSPQTALDAPDAMVITRSMANFFFPGRSALGETLSTGSIRWTVTGVVPDPPVNTHLQFNFLAQPQGFFARPNDGIEWMQQGDAVYAVLDRPDAAPRLVENLNRLADDQELGHYSFLRFSAQHLPDIHLHSQLDHEYALNSDVRYVRLLTVLALLLIFVASINFVNIATARYSTRAVEVGVRKVLGAHRAQLARQFLVESVLLTLVAGLVAVTIVLLMRPYVVTLTGKPLPIYLNDFGVFLAFTVLLGITAGAYPALFLSRFRPISVFKGIFRAGTGDMLLMRMLIGFQLAATIGLATGATVVYLQIWHLQTERVGFDKERVLVINSRTGIGAHYEAFRDELLTESSIASVTTGYRPGESSGGSMLGEEDDYWLLHRYAAGYGYLETLGINLIQGRFFSPEFPGDSAGSIVLSRSAVERLNLEEPVVGSTLEVPGQNSGKEIIGVVDDFNVLSYREPIAPVMISFGVGDVLIKIRSGDTRAVLERVRAIYEQFVPDRPLMYTFLEEEYAALFREERRFGYLFGTFSLVAALVALLGLGGLAAYSIERRTKEIGIRKILGAGTPSIVRLLAGEFVWLSLLAALVAVPVGYLLVRGWLEEFSVRINVGLPLFLVVIVASIGVVLAAVAVQAARASRMNPAVALRSE